MYNTFLSTSDNYRKKRNKIFINSWYLIFTPIKNPHLRRVISNVTGEQCKNSTIKIKEKNTRKERITYRKNNHCRSTVETTKTI